jgi:uncharacterized protein (TIGR03437 family)
VCHGDSMKRLAVLLLVATSSYAQSNWRRLGGSTFDAGLASPATGPVAAVWFSPDGGKLYARTVAGGTWETADFESWSPATSPAPHPTTPISEVRTPENARTVAAANGTIYALGANLFRSEDNGRSWTNLTGFNGRAVIGAGQNDLAVHPRDPQSIFVANAWGVWASHDGGLSWLGLNEKLPNLSISEIAPAGNGIKASLPGIGYAELTPGASTWEPLGGGPDYTALSKVLNATVTAYAAAGDTAYAGSSDGRIWVSRDKGVTWALSPNQAGGPIDRIFVDATAPNVALVASSAKSRSILRTINSGQFWDDITGTLTDNPAHGIAGDRAAGAIYVATDRGVFLARADLNALGTVSSWTSLSGLPDAPARDLKLSGTRVLTAVDGYGVYAASAPLLTGTVRLVSSADLTERPAAPGALFSVVGRKVQSASAGGLNFPVLAAANEESQIQVPFEATGAQLSLTLDRSTMTLALQPVSPAIFLDHEGLPMILDGETGLTLDAKASLHPHSRIQILATGLGKTTPNWPTAMPAPAENPPAVAASVQAFLGAMPVEVTRATLAPGYVGLYLIEMELPAILDAGATELYLSAGGAESNRVRVYLTAER